MASLAAPADQQPARKSLRRRETAPPRMMSDSAEDDAPLTLRLKRVGEGLYALAASAADPAAQPEPAARRKRGRRARCGPAAGLRFCVASDRGSRSAKEEEVPAAAEAPAAGDVSEPSAVGADEVEPDGVEAVKEYAARMKQSTHVAPPAGWARS